MNSVVFDNILKAIGVVAPLLGGAWAALRGTRNLRRKKIDDAIREERADLRKKQDDLDAEKREIDERDKQAMRELTAKVEKLAGELNQERTERQRQSEEFFRILQTFRSREWKLTAHIHSLETLLKAHNISFEALAQELRELPSEINRFFRRATDPQIPAAQDTPELRSTT